MLLYIYCVPLSVVRDSSVLYFRRITSTKCCATLCAMPLWREPICSHLVKLTSITNINRFTYSGSSSGTFAVGDRPLRVLWRSENNVFPLVTSVQLYIAGIKSELHKIRRTCARHFATLANNRELFVVLVVATWPTVSAPWLYIKISLIPPRGTRSFHSTAGSWTMDITVGLKPCIYQYSYVTISDCVFGGVPRDVVLQAGYILDHIL